jgi:ubiquinone/menaquinone biosynthesis C-methylase UbiE
MSNSLAHLSDGEYFRFTGFATRHPGIVARHHMLQKLAIFDFVAPIVARHAHQNILEIGCGLGIHSALLSSFGAVAATELQAPGSFVGADRDVDSGRAVLWRALATHSITFTANDGRMLPFPDRAFDIVFHNSVIEHVPDIVAFNREVRRVLKPGGICICITGTSMLCAFRYVKDYLLKLPFIVAVALAREVRWASGLARRVLSAMGRSAAVVKKAGERLQRIDERLAAVAGTPPQPEASAGVARVDVRALYPRLFHYIYFPEYNRIVLEEIARELGLSPDDLLRAIARQFERRLNRFRFSLTPRTHGQHYRNAWHELKDWSMGRWAAQFAAADLPVESMQGYRYHHVLEATPRAAWDSALYLRAVRVIHAARWLRERPALASEFIMVSRKPATDRPLKAEAAIRPGYRMP